MSSYVYGEPQRLPIGEDHPVAAANPYAHTKILAEEAARFYEQRFRSLLSLIVRPFNIYGPGTARFVSHPLDCAASAGPIRQSRKCPGSATQARLSFYVADAIDLFVNLLRQEYAWRV
jgi:nucleoside-diphosphate-sugar epimerase